MKTFKKALCVMLSILMAFSCLSVVSFAEGEQVKSSFKYYAEKSDAYNAKVTLDKLDGILKDLDIYEKVEIGSLGTLELDLRSVNAACATLDEYIGIIRLATILPGAILGDLKDLELKGWEKGMSRTEDDILILKEIIELIAANKALVSKVCDGSIDLGVFKNYVNLKSILGEDGVSGMLKEFIIGVVYKEGTAEFKNAYNTYKNDIDAFIYGDLVSMFADDYLPGFTLDADSTVEELICLAFEIVVDKYIIAEAKKVNINLAASDEPALKALDGIINLKGSTYDFTDITLDPSKDLLGQLNGLFGAIVKQFVPAYTGWESGGYDKIAYNLEKALKYVFTQSGLIPDADALSFEELAVEIVGIVLSNADFGAYDDGIAECDNLQDMATVLLKNTADEMEIGVEYDEDDSYLVVVGDIFADWFYDRFDITDLDGNAYQAGNGEDIFDVMNYYLNYFLFDKGGAAAAGLSTTKSEDVFKKIDKILDYFGETKTKGVSFDSKEFLLGSASEKGLLDSIFTFDIENILEITVIPALQTAGDVSAVEFIYKTVQYLLNNWAGKTLFPAYQDKAFTNALSNESIANMASVLLETVNARKTSIVTLATYVAALLFKDAHKVYTVTEAKVENAVATGSRINPVAKVSLDGKALTQGKDYVVTTKSVAPGEAKAKIRLVGMYDGEFERSFRIELDSVKEATFLSNSNSVKFVWDKVPFADGYNVYILRNGEYKLLNDELVTKNEFLLTGLAAATEYTVRVDAVSSKYGTSQGEDIGIATIPESVNAKTIRTLTDSTRVRLVWTPVEGASHYRVERYIGSNKWQNLGETTKTDVILGGHLGYTVYNYRITALKKMANGEFVASTPASVNVKTTLGAVTKVSVSYTSNSITLKWDAVTNAQKYQVLRYNNGTWQSVAVLDAKTTSYKATGLKTATMYRYAVRAAVKESSGWKMGGHYIVNQYTGLAKPTTFRVAATNATAAKIEWSAVPYAKGYQVFQYKSGTWVSLGMTTQRSCIINNLPSGVNSYFRVRAVTIVNGAYHFGDATTHVTALTLPGKVTGIDLIVRTTNSISFEWNKVAGAAGYQIFRLHNGSWVSLGMTTQTKCTDSRAMSKGVEYQYRVRAVQKIGSTLKYGAPSDIFKAKTTLIGSATYLA